MESEVAANSQALDSATSMREEALQKFRDDEKDMLVNIMSLKNALVVLEKNLDTSFLQMSAVLQKKVRNVVNNAKADEILRQILNPSDRNTLTAFMQGKLSTGFHSCSFVTRVRASGEGWRKRLKHSSRWQSVTVAVERTRYPQCLTR